MSEVNCPFCGIEIHVSDGQGNSFCPSCGQRVSALAALASGNPSIAGPVPSAVEALAADAKKGTDVAHPSSSSSLQTGGVGQRPYLSSWKTSFGMFFLGLVLSTGLSIAFGLVDTRSPIFILIVAASIAYVVIVYVYALSIYPSLFTEKPKLKSSSAGSFLNSFAGGLIFGALWCSSLTKGRKGFSQYVLVAILSIEFVATLIFGVYAYTSINPNASIGQFRQPSSVQNIGGKSDQQFASDSEEDGKAEVIEQLYEHPEDFLQSDEAKEFVRQKKTGIAHGKDPILDRISFGHYPGTSEPQWYPCEQSSQFVGTSRFVAAEIVGIAFLQMNGGDIDEMRNAIRQTLEEADIRFMSANPSKNDPNTLEGMAMSEGSFSVDGETYYLDTMFWYEGHEAVSYQWMRIGTKAMFQ